MIHLLLFELYYNACIDASAYHHLPCTFLAAAQLVGNKRQEREREREINIYLRQRNHWALK
jgi:hypothetical protein